MMSELPYSCLEKEIHFLRLDLYTLDVELNILHQQLYQAFDPAVRDMIEGKIALFHWKKTRLEALESFAYAQRVITEMWQAAPAHFTYTNRGAVTSSGAINIQHTQYTYQSTIDQPRVHRAEHGWPYHKHTANKKKRCNKNKTRAIGPSGNIKLISVPQKIVEKHSNKENRGPQNMVEKDSNKEKQGPQNMVQKDSNKENRGPQNMVQKGSNKEKQGHQKMVEKGSNKEKQGPPSTQALIRQVRTDTDKNGKNDNAKIIQKEDSNEKNLQSIADTLKNLKKENINDEYDDQISVLNNNINANFIPQLLDVANVKVERGDCNSL